MWCRSPHRLCACLLILTRIIFKRVVGEAADVIVLTREAHKSSRKNYRLALLAAFWSHVMFATVGAERVCKYLRGHDFVFTEAHLEAIRSLILHLESEDRGKLTDLSRTLTGVAYIDRVLRGKTRKANMKACEDTIDALLEGGLFRNGRLTFHEVYRIVLGFPLYGKTRGVNLTRACSALRESLGFSSLEHDEESWKDIVSMHENVRGALDLLGMSTPEVAEEACRVLSSLVYLSYSDGHSRAMLRDFDYGDIALIACEYTCILKELLHKHHQSGSELRRCQWLLGRLPSTLEGIQSMRGRIVSHCKRSRDLATGYDDSRARNVLEWWIGNSRLKRSPVCTWPNDCSMVFNCKNCEEIKSRVRCVDSRALFCSDDCSHEYRNAKRQKKST